MQSVNKKLIQVMKLIELIIAICLIVAIVLSTIASIVYGAESIMDQSFQLEVILEKALTLVVGVEFVKMLAKHTAENLLEVLMFAIARQMIVEHLNMIDTLIGIISIAIIFFIRKYLLLKTTDNKAKVYDKL